jgi:hypothetical protein
MFEPVHEKNLEKASYNKDFLHIFEQLSKELQSLTSQMDNLLMIEDQLLSMLNEEVEAKKTKVIELTSAVEEQETKCLQLTRILNANIRE